MNGSLTLNDWTNIESYGDVRVFNDSGPYTLAFSNNVVVKVTASFDLQLMTVTIVMEPNMGGKIEGLLGKITIISFHESMFIVISESNLNLTDELNCKFMIIGNFNGDKEDEFTFPNGTVLFNSSATEEEVYPWGLSWMTTPETSLFTYCKFE